MALTRVILLSVYNKTYWITQDEWMFKQLRLSLEESQDGPQAATPLCKQTWLIDSCTSPIMSLHELRILLHTAPQAEPPLDGSCHVERSLLNIPDVDHKKKLYFSSLLAIFFPSSSSSLWKCLRTNSLGFGFPAESLNGSLLVMSLWKVGHFRSSTREFDRIAEARLHLSFWAFYSTADIDGSQLLEQMGNCAFRERKQMGHSKCQSNSLGWESFLWWQRDTKWPWMLTSVGSVSFFLEVMSKVRQMTTQNKIMW